MRSFNVILIKRAASYGLMQLFSEWFMKYLQITDVLYTQLLATMTLDSICIIGVTTDITNKKASNDIQLLHLRLHFNFGIRINLRKTNRKYSSALNKS